MKLGPFHGQATLGRSKAWSLTQSYDAPRDTVATLRDPEPNLRYFKFSGVSCHHSLQEWTAQSTEPLNDDNHYAAALSWLLHAVTAELL